MQKIVGKILKANDEFKILKRGDKIGVGVSGGKDSLVLLEGMCRIKKFLDFDLDIVAITVELKNDDFENEYETVKSICSLYDVEHIVEKTSIENIVFKEKNQQKNPCSLCSKLRKGVLNEIARKKGCNKVAFGHHLDDVVETFFMNLFSEGRIACFSPVTYFSRQDLYLIRPLVFVEENYIKKLVQRLNYVIIKNSCSKDGKTYREVVKNFLSVKERHDKGFKKRIFGALRRSGINGWGFVN